MSTSDIKKGTLADVSIEQDQSEEQVQQAAEALRIAAESAQQQQQQEQQQHQQHQQHHHHHHHTQALQPHSQFHNHGDQQHSLEREDEIELTEYDLKSKDSKYRRWSPKMDQFLIKLLSDVVHSFPKGAVAEMTKKAWAYVTGQLRAANPETVYSTYTKYSCQQHLINVNHHRYKIWYLLIVHQNSNHSNSEYSYRWDPDTGRFQVFENSTHMMINDERQVKSLLYSDSLSLPSLNSFNKGSLIVNDFFLSDNLKYMSVYHNEVLPLLIRLDSKFAEGLGDIYAEIPKFDFRESRNDYFKPLVPAKHVKVAYPISQDSKKRSHPDSSNQVLSFTNSLSSMSNENGNQGVSVADSHDDDSVDPALKRSKNNIAEASEFEKVLATAAIAAINSPAVTSGHDLTPFYIKDRKWFNKLISLSESGHLEVSEVVTVCEGVRDGKIPLFMLNVLDHDYYITKNHEEITPELSSEAEIVKRIRHFMLPMTYDS